MNTTVAQQLTYSFEEFMDHVRAMRTVQEWQHTVRFGDVGTEQTSRANNARIVEYFSDSYTDQKEALQKAELFLSISDYLARNAAFFSRRHLLEDQGQGLMSVEPALLRSVHFAFTIPDRLKEISPKRIANLARAFRGLEPTT